MIAKQSQYAQRTRKPH